MGASGSTTTFSFWIFYADEDAINSKYFVLERKEDGVDWRWCGLTGQAAVGGGQAMVNDSDFKSGFGLGFWILVDLGYKFFNTGLF